MRLEELGDQVGLLGWSRGFDNLVVLLVEVTIFDCAIGALCASTIMVTNLGGQEALHGLLFCFQSSGEVV